MSLHDYNMPPQARIRPTASDVSQMGPLNSPVKAQSPAEKVLNGMLEELRRVSNLLSLNFTSYTPIIRSAAVTGTGATLDWSMHGKMQRIVLRNKGASSVWMTFDMDGANVPAYVCDNSYELQANESLALEACTFEKVGLRCAQGGTATVHAIAFKGGPPVGAGGAA
jgi:hypothetical protein